MWLDDLPEEKRKAAFKSMEYRKEILYAWSRGYFGKELARRLIEIMNERIERIWEGVA